MRERPFVKNGKTLLSGFDPVRLSERTADTVSVRDRTLFLCPSPLYGYGLARLLSRIEAEAPDSAILCVEADPELYGLSLESGIPSLAPEKMLRITNICESAELCAFVRNAWGERAFRRVETVRFTGGWQLFPQLYESLCDTLRREIAVDWSNALTLAKLGRLYIRNALKNLPLVTRYPSIENLSFGGSSVLVLGAGPSLDETLNALSLRFAGMLSSESRPFKIICVDTCLGALKDRNIVPDLVVILESQHWNLRDFTGCRGWNVPVAVDLSALPESACMLGEGFLFMTPWTHLRIFERLKEAALLPAVVAPLGSVGLSAVEIARRTTSGKIICAGLDFSFTEDKYHACGTSGHRGKLNAQTRLRGMINAAAYDDASFAAVSKNGSAVRTNPAMRNYRNLFEQEFSSDPRLFDIEGSGLPLGIRTLALEDALLLLGEEKERRNFTAEFHGEEHGVALSEERDLLTEKVLAFFESEIARLKELRDILMGETAGERLGVLVGECDYLWAHFPDCSGGRRPLFGENEQDSQERLSFLKRLRAEIDPMLALVKRAAQFAPRGSFLP